MYWYSLDKIGGLVSGGIIRSRGGGGKKSLKISKPALLDRPDYRDIIS